MIPFNKPPKLGNELTYLEQAINSEKLCGDGPFSKKCEKWLEKNFDVKKALLTPSCTAALELAAILIDVQPGDEIIMPSFTFVSTANAFVLRGAKIVFVDIRSDTQNINEELIENAISDRTKAIVPVHYAGVACCMDAIMEIASRYRVWVIEDAAQGVMSNYKGKALGSIGHIGCYSFHETKNYSSGGEGGAILINDNSLIERAEIIREKGTNRSQFLHGKVDKYTWQDVGSSFLPSELQAAYLFAQLERASDINISRLAIWSSYFKELKSILREEQLPYVPANAVHNAHMFYIVLNDIEQRSRFIKFMHESGIITSFHYSPLHKSNAGLKYSSFVGTDEHTTRAGNCLVRLPLFYGLSEEECSFVTKKAKEFFDSEI